MKGIRGAALTASAAMLLVCSLTGCGKSPAPLDAQSEAQVESELASLSDQVYGSLDAVRAYELIGHVRFQQSLTKCFADSGADYSVAPFEDAYAGQERRELPGSLPEAWYADQAVAAKDGFGRGAYTNANAEAERAINTPVQRSHSYELALAACNSLPSTEPATPQSVQDLGVALDSVIRKAVRDSGSDPEDGSYAACMATAGFEDAARDELIGTFDERYAQFTSSQSAPEPTGAAFDAVRTDERKAAVADSACRADAHAAYLATIGPRLADFRSEHVDQLASSDAYWTSLVSQAASLKATWSALQKSNP